MSACSGKRWYPSYPYAKRAAAAVGSPGLRPYLCTGCDGWHIGHARREGEIIPGLDTPPVVVVNPAIPAEALAASR